MGLKIDWNVMKIANYPYHTTLSINLRLAIPKALHRLFCFTKQKANVTVLTTDKFNFS